MMRAHGLLPGFAAAVLLAVPLAGQQQEGQQGPPGQPPGQVAEAELVFEREVFAYPTFQRPNPFRSLAGGASGPRYEQMELKGIIYAEEVADRVAILSLRGQARQQLESRVRQEEQQQIQGTAPVQDTIYVPEPAQRLRTGERWGNVRVLQIRIDHVVLEVTEFGLTEQQILRMPVRRQGGLP